MKTLWRYTRDALVIIMAILVIGPYLVGEPWYDDAVTPDETKELDNEITLLLPDVEPLFQTYLDSPLGASGFQPYRLAKRKQLTPAYSYLQNVESIVYITSEDSLGDQYFGTGSIVSSDGVIVSNYHNIYDAEKVVVTTYNGTHYPAVAVLASDAVKDVIFLKIEAKNLRPMPIGDDTEMAIGEQTLVIGHPEGFLNSVSQGVLSGRRLYRQSGEGMQLQITNPISSGNSGGAVLNEYGELVGIPTATVEYEDNSVQVQNINLAVPISEALKILE